MSRYDIAIIGSGPAGLEAAITAKVRNKNIIVFGTKDLSRKMQVVEHPVLNYLGMPGLNGKEMVEVFYKQITDLGIEVCDKKVTSVYAMGEYFMLQLDDNDMVEASTVILAAGVAAGRPYPNEERFLGRGVSYCATCDAPLYRGKDVIVIGSSAAEEAEVEFLAEVCRHVTYIPLYPTMPKFQHDVTIVKERPVEIIGENAASGVRTDQGEYYADGVFILREAQFPGQLVPGLTVEGSAVKVDLQMKTNLPGLFAAGDITGLPYQYMKAAGQGNVAALSAVDHLAKNKK